MTASGAALDARPAPARSRRAAGIERRAWWGFQLAMIASVADVSAIELGGINIRIAWLLLPIAAMLIRRGPRDHFWTVMTFALIAIHVIAGLASPSPMKGVAYGGWILFSYLMLFRAGVNASRVLGLRAWDAVIANGRFQIIVSLLLVAAGVHDRTQFLYYEASYMAIGLTPYVFAAIHLSKKRWLDFTLIALLLAGNQSANQALVLGIAIIIWLFQEGLTLRTMAVLLSIPLLGVAMVVQALSSPLSANYNIVTYIRDHGISFELIKVGLERGGNRVPRIQAGLEVAQDFPFLGVGPGNYVDYSASRDFQHIHGGLWWLDPGGLPAVNVVVEAAANAGVVAAALLVIAFLALFIKAVRHPNLRVRRAIVGALIATAVAMQFESSYLRAYLWLAFGLYVGQLSSGQRRRIVRATAASATPSAAAGDGSTPPPDVPAPDSSEGPRPGPIPLPAS